MKNKYENKCKMCRKTLQKRGKTASGKQRYYCVNCDASSTIKKVYLTKRSELKMFLDWALSKKTRVESCNESRSTFVLKTRWCWDLIPTINNSEISPKFLVVDTTFLEKNVGLMVVRNDEYVLNFKWCETENCEDYFELLSNVKEPKVLICDGNIGLMKAAKKLWKNVNIQWYLFHICLNAKAKLGKRSPYLAVHEFREHILKIATINTIKKSENWYKKLENLCKKHKSFLDEKSYVIDPVSGEVLKEFKKHKKPNSMINLIRKLYKKDMLFLYLKYNFPSTSNLVEGGINARIKELIRCHRGLDLEKRKRICEWYLLSRSAENLDESISRFSSEKLD